eukprot:748470-Hanusia_phi.AAC.1
MKAANLVGATYSKNTLTAFEDAERQFQTFSHTSSLKVMYLSLPPFHPSSPSPSPFPPLRLPLPSPLSVSLSLLPSPSPSPFSPLALPLPRFYPCPFPSLALSLPSSFQSETNSPCLSYRLGISEVPRTPAGYGDELAKRLCGRRKGGGDGGSERGNTGRRERRVDRARKRDEAEGTYALVLGEPENSSSMSDLHSRPGERIAEKHIQQNKRDRSD